VQPDVTLAAISVWIEVSVLAPVWMGMLRSAIHCLEKTKTVSTLEWPRPMQSDLEELSVSMSA
jgi:hypothetical protein